MNLEREIPVDDDVLSSKTGKRAGKLTQNHQSWSREDWDEKAKEAKQEMELAQQKLMEEVKTIFEMIDVDGGGTLSVQEIRKALKKNKKVKKFCEKSSLLAPLLVPRLFHSTMRLMDTNGDGEISFEEFSSFCKEMAVRQVLDDQARHVFETLGGKKGKLTFLQFPYLLYENETVLQYLLECEQNAENDIKVGLEGNKKYPIRLLLDPKAVHTGIKAFVEGNENLSMEMVLEELDFLLMCTSIASERQMEENREGKMEDPCQADGRAEAFAEMAFDAMQIGNIRDAIMYREQCITRRPYNKVYRLALAELYLQDENYEKAIENGEWCLQCSGRFWMPAWDVINSARTRQKEAEVARQLEEARLKEEEQKLLEMVKNRVASSSDEDDTEEEDEE